MGLFIKKFSCILIEDDPLSIDRLEALLLKTNTTTSIIKLCDPTKAVSLILAQRPDVIFLDVEMPQISGFDIIKQVHFNLFFPTFIFTTAYHQYVIRAIKAGVFDYLMKPIDMDELQETIKRYFLKKKQIPLPENCSLSAREREVLELVAEGKTSQEIADLLHLSKHTVDTHRRKIKRKMK
ncbi:MAG: response regulator [Mangrovibacterium sp.]